VLPLLLVITADRDLSEPFRRELSAAGFKAYYVETLSSAIAVVGQWRFDAALMHGRGFEAAAAHMLRSLREGAAVPLLLVVDRASEELQLQALESGASRRRRAPRPRVHRCRSRGGGARGRGAS
jgi:DNA-binding response OmpR family regulator